MQFILGNREARTGAIFGAAGMLVLLVAAAVGYWCGRADSPSYSALLDLRKVSTAAGGTNMAVATGAVSDDAEGVFFLDFLTGDLQCLVYYPRSGAFGARYYTNVQAQMPGAGKSAQYLMVTGSAITNRTSSNLKPANCLVYITDVNNGTFAAYTVPWNKSAESSAQAQGGPLIFVGGGPIRNYQITEPAKKPAGAAGALKDPAMPGRGNAGNAGAGNAGAGNLGAGNPAAMPGGADPAAADPNALDPAANPNNPVNAPNAKGNKRPIKNPRP